VTTVWCYCCLPFLYEIVFIIKSLRGDKIFGAVDAGTTYPNELTNLVAKAGFESNQLKRVDILVISNRGSNSIKPFQGLVNSLLEHTSNPVHLHIVSDTRPDWQQNLNSTEHFKIYYQGTAKLQEQAKDLNGRVKYRSTHYSKISAYQKLFLSTMNFPPGTPSKILLIDDDYVFYEDATGLMEKILEHPDRISLQCPIDPARIQGYFNKTNMPLLGHHSRYCNAGMMFTTWKQDNKNVHRRIGNYYESLSPVRIQGGSRSRYHSNHPERGSGYQFDSRFDSV
jgi:hypothetical protein